MSYSLILRQVPPGTPEEAIEKIAESLNQAEIFVIRQVRCPKSSIDYA